MKACEEGTRRHVFLSVPPYMGYHQFRSATSLCDISSSSSSVSFRALIHSFSVSPQLTPFILILIFGIRFVVRITEVPG